MDKPSNVKPDIPLSSLVSLKVGGPADWYCAPKSGKELQELIAWSRGTHQPFIILGGGSNVIVADHGYRGLVIHLNAGSVTWEGDVCIVDAGVQLSALIEEVIMHNRGDLEHLVGIPGTVGGAIVCNAGNAYHWISQSVRWVEVIDSRLERRRLHQEECGFGYRQSQFQQDNSIVLQVGLTFPPADQQTERHRLDRTRLRQHLSQPEITSAAVRMFRNPVVRNRIHPQVLGMADEHGRVRADDLIRSVGLNGFAIGGIEIGRDYPNFIFQRGPGTADEAVQLISLVKQRVRDTLGIQLHDDLNYLGFNT